MSYNIDSWKLKKLDGLVIPISALYEESRGSWNPEQPVIEDILANVVHIDVCENGYIEGKLVHSPDPYIVVSDIKLSGEGSGNMLHYCIEPALRRSKGTLEVVLVWEGGDSITRLRVLDGNVSQERVEL